MSDADTRQVDLMARGFRKDHDLPLKLRIGSALATSGYYTRINVGLSAVSARGLGDVTDIDVLGMGYDVTFAPTAVAVSCKSGESKSLSPAREIFYLRGVLEYVRAGSGVAAFSRKIVPAHLRDLGRRLNVLVLSGGEVDEWCESLRNGLEDRGYYDEAHYEEYRRAWARAGKQGLGEYLRTDYWFHFDFRNLQNTIVHFRKIASHLTGREGWHTLVVLDTAAHLCLTVLDLCRQVRLLGPASVMGTTQAYLFGGAPSFKARRDLYSRVEHLLSSTGVVSATGPALPPLEPAYSEALAELAVRFIDRPHAAVLVPGILQDALWKGLGAPGAARNESINELAGEKLAIDLLEFMKRAAGSGWLPRI